MSVCRYAVVGCLVCLGSFAATNALERVDRVVAVVGDSVVLESELEAYTLLRLNNAGDQLESIPMDTLRRQFLDELINDKVFLVHAEKDSTISVSSQEVEDALERQIDAILRQNNLTIAQLEEELQRSNNMSLAELKEQYRVGIRKQLLQQKVHQKYMSSVSLTRKDVEQFYTEYKDSLPSAGKSVRLQKVAIDLKPSDRIRQDAFERISKIRERISSGEDFIEMAKQFSDDPNAEQGGDLGFIAKGTLGELTFEEKAFSLEPGQVSSVFETRLGFHIIKVEEKKNQMVYVRQILVSVTPTEQQVAQVKSTLDSIRINAKTTENFADAVKKFSTDNQSRSRGGDIGWVSTFRLSSAVFSAIDTLEVGEITVPLKSGSAYEIYRVVDKTDSRTYTLEDDWDLLAEKAKDIYAQKRLINLVKKWRQEEFVNVQL